MQYCASLLDAAKPLVSTAGGWLQTGNAATLCHRATGKQPVQVFHAAFGVKPLLQCIMQLTGIDRRVIVLGIEFLQCPHHVPSTCIRFQTIGRGGLGRLILCPALRRIRI